MGTNKLGKCYPCDGWGKGYPTESEQLTSEIAQTLDVGVPLVIKNAECFGDWYVTTFASFDSQESTCRVNYINHDGDNSSKEVPISRVRLIKNNRTKLTKDDYDSLLKELCVQEDTRRLAAVVPAPQVGSPHRLAADEVNNHMALFSWIAMLFLVVAFVYYKRYAKKQKQDAMQRGQLQKRSLDRSRS